MFAKIFETEEYGQVLVVKDINDVGNPCVNVSSEPEGYGVCTMGISYKDNDDGWEKQEAYFDSFDLADAEKAAKAIFDSTRQG